MESYSKERTHEILVQHGVEVKTEDGYNLREKLHTDKSEVMQKMRGRCDSYTQSLHTAVLSVGSSTGLSMLADENFGRNRKWLQDKAALAKHYCELENWAWNWLFMGKGTL